jgi:hypothetical protein
MRLSTLILGTSLALGCATAPPPPPERSRDVVSVERVTHQGRSLGFVTGVHYEGQAAGREGWWVKDPTFRPLGFVTPDGNAYRLKPDGSLEWIGHFDRALAVAAVYGLSVPVRLEEEPDAP